jgi:hypothetical protein
MKTQTRRTFATLPEDVFFQTSIHSSAEAVGPHGPYTRTIFKVTTGRYTGYWITIIEGGSVKHPRASTSALVSVKNKVDDQGRIWSNADKMIFEWKVV